MSEDLEKLRNELFELRCKIIEQGQETKYKELRSAHWPDALIKAVDDPFDYAVGLKDGAIIFFEYAVPQGESNEWVHLILNNMHDSSNAYRQSFNYRIGVGKARGLDVRVSEIVWVADAPFGS